MVNTRVMALLQQRAVAAITEARERGETGAIDARSECDTPDGTIWWQMGH